MVQLRQMGNRYPKQVEESPDSKRIRCLARLQSSQGAGVKACDGKRHRK